jgi:hypothetical protein
MTTLVSSFYSNINKRNDRNFENYLNYGITLLKANINKVIFTDQEMYDKIREYENDNTKIILTKKEDIYLYNYINNVENFQLNTTCPSKDTIDYMFIMCNKTEAIKNAIEINYFNTTDFIWVDFGIKHVFKNNTNEEFIKIVEKLNDKNYDKIRIASIWNPNLLYNVDIYKDINWYFAGGVFGGNKDSLMEFANKTKEKCIQIIKEKNTLMWETNVWYLVYLDNKSLFDFYTCGHNNTIIEHY